jgi:hypothetical protein
MFCIPFSGGVLLLNAQKLFAVYDNFAFELFILLRIKAEHKTSASAFPVLPYGKP